MNETYFEQLLQWLARCPALTGIDLRVDDLPPAAGTGALFPKGVEQTDRWQNLLGQVTARQPRTGDPDRRGRPAGTGQR